MQQQQQKQNQQHKRMIFLSDVKYYVSLKCSTRFCSFTQNAASPTSITLNVVKNNAVFGMLQ